MSFPCEILSPAGSRAALEAAVLSGADAVYFGAGGFNARAFAENFSTEEEVVSAVGFCHERGVKAYIALNTLVRNGELKDALLLARSLTNAGADAFIVQDVGLASLLKQSCDVPLHASTQMSVHSLEGVLALAEMGFSRAVLARELSLDDIKKIAKASPIELEVFVHGALCMCYSGQCYMSSVIGQRSGNRGKCAQPCRLPYKVSDRKNAPEYPLSLKDLSLLRYVGDLSEAGVVSLKIEGRMKSPEYVAAVTKAYAEAKNGSSFSQPLEDALADIFSRGGFTQGYFEGKTGPSMFGRKDSPSEKYKMNLKEGDRVPLDFTVSNGDGRIFFSATDGEFSSSAECEYSPARNAPLTAFSLEEQLSKLGSTPYFLRSARIDLPENAFLLTSQINAVRNSLAAEISLKRREKRIYSFSGDASLDKPLSFDGLFCEAKPFFAPRQAWFMNAEKACCPDEFDFIWLPLWQISAARRFFEENREKTGFYLPRVVQDSEYQKLLSLLSEAKEMGAVHLLVGNIGLARTAAGMGFTLHGDTGLNIFNGRSSHEATAMGFSTHTFSFECNLSDISSGDTERGGIAVYGRLPFMHFKNCVKQNCNKKVQLLTDRTGRQFPAACDFGCRNTLYNSDVLWLADKNLPKAAFHRFLFTLEEESEVREVCRAYDLGLPAKTDFTRGLYFKNL